MGRDTVDFDVAIIGGGPAGASMAAYLAQAGVKCVVFERQLFPREHVGESLVPSSTRVFKDLGFLEKMEEAGFPHKYGALWTAEEGARAYEHGWEVALTSVSRSVSKRGSSRTTPITWIAANST